MDLSFIDNPMWHDTPLTLTVATQRPDAHGRMLQRMLKNGIFWQMKKWGQEIHFKNWWQVVILSSPLR
eukprot:12410843-Karenia_brevis.AAC.1